jgi:hypothetical protein
LEVWRLTQIYIATIERQLSCPVGDNYVGRLI